MVLDEEGWKELTKYLRGVLSAVEKIESRSRARLKKGDDGAGITTSFALLHFESPPREPS
jgi:hypothetical protein